MKDVRPPQPTKRKKSWTAIPCRRSISNKQHKKPFTGTWGQKVMRSQQTLMQRKCTVQVHLVICVVMDSVLCSLSNGRKRHKIPGHGKSRWTLASWPLHGLQCMKSSGPGPVDMMTVELKTSDVSHRPISMVNAIIWRVKVDFIVECNYLISISWIKILSASVLVFQRVC